MNGTFLDNLNPPQREAVAHTDGPLLVLAGPGSGKTRVITRRAARIATEVVRPEQVLAITFTNKAAEEMRSRIVALGAGEGMTVCTFHALCAKLLRMYGDRAGIPRGFTIFDVDDRRRVLKDVIEACGLSTTNYPPAAIEQRISRAKNDMIDAAGYAERHDDWQSRAIARIYDAYERRMADMGGLDFDDLLMRTAKLLMTDADLVDLLGRRFRYVLIDEYQDTNDAQYQIARLLASRHRNLCATGDPDQSIYGWRGANVGNILSFEKDYPEATVVRLEQNYRSTKRILAVADHLIAQNRSRKHKSLWTEGEEGDAVRMVQCASGHDEARYIAGQIRKHLAGGGRGDEVAIFYRVNALSRGVEEALLAAGVPYQIARGVEFYGRKEIKDVLAYLRVLVNHADEVALKRIINTPTRGIGDKSISRLLTLAESKGVPVYDMLMDVEALAPLGRSAGAVVRFAETIGDLAPALAMGPQAALEHVISHSGLRAMHHQAAQLGDEDALANVDELVSAAAEFERAHPGATIVDWLEHAALVSDVDAVREGGGAVTLMTLHAAKGLEFDIVYVIGLEENLLPYRRRDDEGLSEADVEEERRLCFVGMTRARRQLTLTHAQYRMMRGITQRTSRSPFLVGLKRVGAEEVADIGAVSGMNPGLPPGGRLPKDVEEWTIGTLVRHPQYGLGQLIGMFRGSARTHVRVQFESGRQEAIVLEYGELERVPFDEVD
jgi:DNA helicase-2/ATP-dependent DNA helicase PcrA